MAIVYFDSSAFVKLLVEEDGTDVAAALWDGCDAAFSSRIAYPRCEPHWPRRRERGVWVRLTVTVPRRRGRGTGRRPGWSS